MDKYAKTVWHYIPMRSTTDCIDTPKLKRSLKSRAVTSNHPLKVSDTWTTGLLPPHINPQKSFPKTTLTRKSPLTLSGTSLCSSEPLSHQHHTASQFEFMEEDSDRDRSMHCYRHGEQYTLAVSLMRKIPSTVTMRYDHFQKRKKNVNFSQGYLERCQHVYYSVEDELFLFPAEDLFNKDLDGLSFKMKDNLLYFAQQVILMSRFALPFALLLAHPWKIELFSCGSSTKLVLHSLSVVSIDCERPSRFISAQESLFYCDEAGKAFKITTKPQCYFSLFPTRSNTLGSYCLKGSRLIHVFENEGKLQPHSIWHFMRKVCCDIKCLFLSHSHKHKITARQDELYTLCESMTAQGVYSQTVSVYSTSKMEFLRSFCLSEILEQIPQQIGVHVTDMSAPTHSPYLLILLSSGFRVYLKTNPVKVLKVLPPPDLLSVNSAPDRTKQKRVGNCKPNQKFNLIGSNLGNQSLISIVQSQGKAVTYLIHPSRKHKQSFYEEDVRIIDWHEPDLECRDHFVYSCSLDHSFQGEMKTDLGGFRWPHRRRAIGNELLQPRRYIYATDLFLKMAVILRPIDTILSIVSVCKCGSKCVEAIKKILEIDTEAQIKQTIILLLEIYTDCTGVYYSESKIEEQLRSAISEASRSKYDAINSDKTPPNLTKKEYKNISREVMEIVWQTAISLAGEIKRQSDLGVKGETFGGIKTQIYGGINGIKTQIDGESMSNKIISQSGFLIFQKHLRPYRKRYLNELKAEECQQLIQRGEQIRKVIARGKTGDRIIVQLTKCRQLLLLINSVTPLPQMQLESALSQPYSYFHESIFRCVMANFESHITQEMKDYFPLYIDPTLQHALQLCHTLQKEKRDLKDVELVKDYPNIPSYALLYLKERYNIELHGELVGQTLAVKPLPFVDGYEEALELIHSERTSLYEKQGIRDRQLERLQSYKRDNPTDPQIPKYSRTLEELGRHIRMQSLIYVQYQTVVETDAKMSLIRTILMAIVQALSGETQKQREGTAPILNTYLLNPNKMLELIHSLQSVRLEILFQLIIGGMTEIEFLFDKLDKQNSNSLLKFENELSYILRSTKGVFPPAKLLPEINKFLARNHPLDVIDYLLTQGSISPKQFWVGVFLTERSMGVQQVIEAYRTELIRTFCKDERLPVQQEYLFSLMNVLVLMENYHFKGESELSILIEEQLCAREEEREVVGELRLVLESVRGLYS